MKNKKSKSLETCLHVVLNNNVSKFNQKLQQLEEGFKPIKIVKRTMYPRNFHLSEDFVMSFKKEYRRLLDEGLDNNKALGRITKALLFHTKD